MASELNSGGTRTSDGECRRRLHFVVAGGIGFLVDAGILTLLVRSAGWGPVAARIPSFLTAVSVTWWLNRQWAFRDLRTLRVGTEYRRYIAVQLIGALANLLVYAALIHVQPSLRATPVVPLAVGAIAGLAANYMLSRRFVFMGRA
ncbi:MAG: GtrA family protein [Rhodocyclaceae bacterium]|nr:GtrA family protein [Rhodocyclaceae bacterium]